MTINGINSHRYRYEIILVTLFTSVILDSSILIKRMSPIEFIIDDVSIYFKVSKSIMYYFGAE